MDLNRRIQKFTEDFIEVYRRNKCLWQVKNINYKNSKKRGVAYEELRKFCENEGQPGTVDFVKAKINNIKTGFRKEFRKVQSSKLCATSADEVYEPSLFYYDSMKFTVDQDDPWENDESTAAFPNDTSDLWSKEQVFPDTWNYGQNSPVDQLPNKRRKEEFESVGCSALSDSFPAPSNYLERSEDSKEFDAVGVNVAAKLKKMTSSQQIYAELLINKVLAKGLLNKLTEETDLSDF